MKILFASHLKIHDEYNSFQKYILKIIGSTDIKKLHFTTRDYYEKIRGHKHIYPVENKT